MRDQRGMTLIETAAMLAVAAVLYSQAAPLFTVWIGNTQTRTAAESALNGLQLARAEAIRRNRLVNLSFSTLPAVSWSVGCVNPIDSNSDGIDDPGDCIAVIQARVPLEAVNDPPQLAMVPADATTVTFDSLGRVVANVDGSSIPTQFDISNPRVAAADRRTLRLTIGAAGDIRMCDPALTSNDPRAC